MWKELLDYVNSILPSVDPKVTDAAKEAINQFNTEGKVYEYTTPALLPELSQGDIVSEIPFFYYDDDGNLHNYMAKGMVISTSCHIDQKDYVNIVPVLPLNFASTKKDGNYIKELKANRIYNYMYIPNSKIDDFFADFSMLGTYNKSLIENGLRDKKINRICSLSQLGYYLFIIKLTVFLMRKEDDETMLGRAV